MTASTTGRHQVVIIGSGFGGLIAAKKLRHAAVDVTLISRTTHHLFQPLLYQVATGILSEGEIAPATRDILRRQRNARVVLGDVEDIDVAARTVTSYVGERRTVTRYDSLIVASGARTSYFGNDRFEANAPGLKSVDDALTLRGRILSAFEFAELTAQDVSGAAADAGYGAENAADIAADNAAESRVREWLTFVVVGAGATGVEMAGQIAELARRTLKRDYRCVDPRSARIILVDAADAVLGNFGTRLAAGAAAQLQRLGVEVWLGEKVVDVDEAGLTVEDTSHNRTRVNARTIVWAAGVQASPLAKVLAQQTGAELDRGGRVKVQPDCTLPGHPEIFAIGDMMTLNDYPGVAQVAMQQAGYAVDQIRRRLRGRAPAAPFRYFDKGSMATISRFRAVANVGPFRFGGLLAWLLWLAVHLLYLVGFKNRVTTIVHWAVSFLGRGRSQRTLTNAQLYARAGMTPPHDFAVADPPLAPTTYAQRQ